MTEAQILNSAHTNYCLIKYPHMLEHQVGKATFKATKNKETVILDKITKYLKWIGELGIVVDSAALFQAQMVPLQVKLVLDQTRQPLGYHR